MVSSFKLNPRWLRTLIMAAAVLIVALLMPRTRENKLIYEENRPWGYALLTAPFDIPVYRDAESSKLIRDSIEREFVPFYHLDESVTGDVKNSIYAGDLTALQKSGLIKAVERVYADGVVASSTDSTMSAVVLPHIMLRHGEGKESADYAMKSTERMRSQRNAYMAIDSMIKDDEVRRAAQKINLAAILKPNILPDVDENARRKENALATADVAIGVIQKGERIIDRGDIVTPRLYQVLTTYEQMLAERDTGSHGSDSWMFIGQLLIALLSFGGLYFYLYLYQRNVFDSPRYLTAIVSLIVSFYILALVLSQSISSGLYIVPFGIVPIIVAVFFDGRTALFAYMVTLVLTTVFATFIFEFLFVELVAGVTLIFALQELSRRSQLLRAAMLMFAALLVACVGVELGATGSLMAVSLRQIGYFAIATVLTSFAYILIFIFEKIFGLISTVTLVELSDINNPTLLKLSEECPGTFQHSMGVSNLASTAAARIGANVQMVRTGALYHDIGKTQNPAFYTENQYGINPHDALSPQQSARIIIGHVTDGAKIADKVKLPKAIKDMILQHHGRGLAKYFYSKYCASLKEGDGEPDPAPFTYPGPNPQTREASILMMADAVEAASRSLKEHSVENITELVTRIIDGQVADGLHAESPLSFRDIKQIKESFISRLRSMYHARISYPPDMRRKPAPAKPAEAGSPNQQSNQSNVKQHGEQ